MELEKNVINKMDR